MSSRIKVGTKVRWTAANGTHEGTITDIVISKNASGEYIPWIFIDFVDYRTVNNSQCSLCGEQSYLRMMKFEFYNKFKESWEKV